jgi:hypothetical protein
VIETLQTESEAFSQGYTALEQRRSVADNGVSTQPRSDERTEARMTVSPAGHVRST